MRATFLLVVAAVALAAGPGVASAQHAGCTGGSSFSSGGSSGVAFCGPAKATAKVGSKTYKFSKGTCVRKSKYFYVNLGTEVLNGPKKRYSYLGVLVGAYPGALPGAKAASKDGTYGGALVTIRWQGKDYILNGAGDKTVKVTLKNGRTAGSFSGTTFIEPHLKVTGSFSC